MDNAIRADFILDGLHCAHCAEKITREVAKLEYVNDSSMNFVAKKLSVYMNKNDIKDNNVSEIARTIHNTEDGITVKMNANKVMKETHFDNKGNILNAVLEKAEEKEIRADFILEGLD